MSTPSTDTAPLQVLLTGATGFIGQAIAAALRQAGHTVHTGQSPRHPSATGVAMDFARDTDAATWLPRLQGIDAVVNAVGVLRSSPARPIDAVHHYTPVALFEACRQAGVQRVVQVSALGVQTGTTRYARTKRAADDHLLGLSAAADGATSPVRGVVLRPSVVFGRGGASATLFMRLARLPVLPLPGPVLTARVQPVAVHDLADAVVALLGSHRHQRGVVPCVGPEALPIAALIASLRAQCGTRPAHALRLPAPLTHLSARLGDWLPASPWCSETLAMLATDNVADPAPLQALLAHPATHFSQLVEQAWAPSAATAASHAPRPGAHS